MKSLIESAIRRAVVRSGFRNASRSVRWAPRTKPISRSIRPPEEIVDRLMDLQTDLRDVHWTPADNLHLTLVFLGAHPGPVLSDVDAALLEIDTPAFELTLAGVGALGGRDARVVYAGVRENATLRQLHAKAAPISRTGSPAAGPSRAASCRRAVEIHEPFHRGFGRESVFLGRRGQDSC